MLVKTKEGLEIKIIDNCLDDMRALDALCGMDEGDPLAISRLCSLMFTNEDKEEFYKKCEDETGKVRISKAMELLKEIILLLPKQEKN